MATILLIIWILRYRYTVMHSKVQQMNVSVLHTSPENGCFHQHVHL